MATCNARVRGKRRRRRRHSRILSHCSLDTSESAFYEICRRSNLKLKTQEVTWCQKSLRYMGHFSTEKEGLIPMPTPTDITSLKRFFGTVNYLSKLIPSFSGMTKQPRRLEDKHAELQWTNSHTMWCDQVTNESTGTTLVWCEETSHSPVRCQPDWVRARAAAGESICLLCV